MDAHGEFCVRGGVIDIFPAGSARPFRLDLAGDTVESIRHFDPATQRSVGEVDRVSIVPLREVFTDEGTRDEREARDEGRWRRREGGDAVRACRDVRTPPT